LIERAAGFPQLSEHSFKFYLFGKRLRHPGGVSPSLVKQHDNEAFKLSGSSAILKRNIIFLAVGLVASLGISMFVNYLLLYATALTPYGRSVISAAVVPIVVCLPLLAIVCVQRAQLAKRQRELNYFASHDRLTDFYRPSVFADIVERRRKTADADNPSGAFLIVHADHLREINRRYGLEAGDEALALIAMSIRSSIRADDVVGRIGATMFGIFLPGADEADARDIAERISQNVKGVYFAPAEAGDAISVRVGGVIFADQIGFKDMFREAEDRLFAGEDEGEALTIALGAVRMEAAASH
jgi:diguanylate cyclase